MPNIVEIQKKMYDQLINTGWDQKLRFFIKSEDFRNIIDFLVAETREGYRFTPGVKDLFRPFTITRYPDVKIVVLHPEPYDNPLLNTGLALDSTEGEKTITHRLFQHLIGNQTIVQMATKGVLFLNTTLTTRIGQPRRHQKIWQSFTQNIIEVLNQKDHLAWLLIGLTEEDYQPNPNHFIKILPQLAENMVNPFPQINEYLVDKKLGPVTW